MERFWDFCAQKIRLLLCGLYTDLTHSECAALQQGRISEKQGGMPRLNCTPKHALSCQHPLTAVLAALQSVHRLENVVGWYHSHPGYGCWLSGIDCSTQMLNQQYQVRAGKAVCASCSLAGNP